MAFRRAIKKVWGGIWERTWASVLFCGLTALGALLAIGFLGVGIFPELLKKYNPYFAGVAAGVSAVVVASLVGATIVYARAAKQQADASVRMAEEMKEQRYAALRPIIDIVKWKVRYPRDVVKQEDDIRSGQLQGLPGILHNIGVGPAIDVYSFIQISNNERQFHVFGTLATGATTPEEELSLEQRDGHTILIAYYKDVYGNLFESSREVTVDRDKLSVNVGELKVRPLPKKEHTR